MKTEMLGGRQWQVRQENSQWIQTYLEGIEFQKENHGHGDYHQDQEIECTKAKKSVRNKKSVQKQKKSK